MRRFKQPLTPQTARQFQVRYHQAQLPNLPVSWQGVRLLQLSDLHFHPYTCRRYWQRIIEAVGHIAPDLIVLTGDYIDRSDRYLDLGASILSELQAPLGQLACLGNHDYKDGHHGRAIKSMLAEAGFHALINEALPLVHQGETLWISGLDDIKKGCPDPKTAYAPIPESAPHISLIHNPTLARLMIRHRYRLPHLVLSGHTHAGQVRHPLTNWLMDSVRDMTFRYGWYRMGPQSHIYVTSGIESPCSVSRFCLLPPVRYNTQPEMVVFELQLAQGE